MLLIAIHFLYIFFYFNYFILFFYYALNLSYRVHIFLLFYAYIFLPVHDWWKIHAEKPLLESFKWNNNKKGAKFALYMHVIKISLVKYF